MKSILNQISKMAWRQNQNQNRLRTENLFQIITQRLIDYMSTVKEVALSLFFQLFFSLISLLGLLYLLRVLWSVYQSSPVGQKYTHLFMERSYTISDFLSQNLFDLSIEVTWISFSTCFLICSGLRFFHLTTLLYNNRRGIIKVLLFGLPLALISGWYLSQIPMILSFKQGIILSLLPTMFFFQKCFEATTELIPELGDLFLDFKEILLIVKNKLQI